MCCTRPPHVSVATIFEISRYMFICNALIIRWANSPSFRQTFVLLKTKLHEISEVHSFGYAHSVAWKYHKRVIQPGSRPLHDSVGTIFEISQYIFIKETAHKVAVEEFSATLQTCEGELNRGDLGVPSKEHRNTDVLD
ncbi:hypothetical protein T265_03116 [Opisthorchis viverrini]|uniref:Uncharacterized protein n=1 Tax=Opisthorchis viverrini TaxID=6198 RepID=A0A074ZX48_OPIVI|nr:hypothetical protein T265_03116 [Opisthorchis viverrini]KER30507.1 hypothetical protein T265_03116 [Opisthorchis viverrini]